LAELPQHFEHAAGERRGFRPLGKPLSWVAAH